MAMTLDSHHLDWACRILQKKRSLTMARHGNEAGLQIEILNPTE